MLTDTQCRNAKTTDKPLKLSDGKENLFAVGDYCQQPAGESEEEVKARRDGRRFTRFSASH